MKNHIVFFIAAIALLYPQNNKVNVRNLVEYGGKYFKENDDAPFNGIVFDLSKKSGKKILEYRMRDGQKYGIYKEWNDDGDLLKEGYYKSGLMSKKWKFYFENGKIKGSGQYFEGDGSNLGDTGIPKNGRTNMWEFWYENGQKSQKVNYKNGQLNGLSLYWYENGNKDFESTYKNGFLDGAFTAWYKNGNIKLKGFHKNDTLDGLFAMWYKNGDKKLEGNFNKGVEVGSWAYWDESNYKYEGKVDNENYKNGKFLEFSKYEKFKVLGYFEKKNGRLDGPYIRWLDDELVKGQYKRGEKVGTWIYCNSSGENYREEDWGEIKFETIKEDTATENTYNAGLPIPGFDLDRKPNYSNKKGVWTHRNKYGRKESRGMYKDDKKDGLWIYWTSDNYIYEVTYTENNITSFNLSDSSKNFNPVSIDQCESIRKSRNYIDALLHLQRLVKNDKNIAPRAQYRIGDIFMNDLRDFPRAIQEYRKVIENHKGSEQEPHALFMIGYLYAQILNDYKKAETEYRLFLDQFPNHELSPSVKFELKYLGKSVEDIPALKHIKS